MCVSLKTALRVLLVQSPEPNCAPASGGGIGEGGDSSCCDMLNRPNMESLLEIL